MSSITDFEMTVDIGDFARGCYAAQDNDDFAVAIDKTMSWQIGFGFEKTSPTSRNTLRIAERHNNKIVEYLRGRCCDYPQARICRTPQGKIVVNIDWRGIVDEDGIPLWGESGNCFYIHANAKDAKRRLAEFRHKHFTRQYDAEVTPDDFAKTETTLADILAQAGEIEDETVELDVTITVTGGATESVKINNVRDKGKPPYDPETDGGAALRAAAKLAGDKARNETYKDMEAASRKKFRDTLLEIITYLETMRKEGSWLAVGSVTPKFIHKLRKLRHGLFLRPRAIDPMTLYERITGESARGVPFDSLVLEMLSHDLISVIGFINSKNNNGISFTGEDHKTKKTLRDLSVAFRKASEKLRGFKEENEKK